MANAYKSAGVDIEAGYEAVERIKKHVERTKRLGVMGALGSFGGLFDLSVLHLKEPVLVSGTDGVGTKLKIAFMMDKHDTIGIDCVAMCVNDIIVQGASPIFFLDYLACGKNEPAKIEQVVKGIADGCEQAGCALIGGETAEMPGMYAPGEYDLAGFAVGACEKSELISGSAVEPGDVLIGLPSSGIHSNGYSLVRKIFFEEHQLEIDSQLDGLNRTLGEALIEPTRIYVKQIQSIQKRGTIKGMAHITGGGFIENIPRALPSGYGAEIAEGTWEMPAIFEVLKEYGKLDRKEMYNVFNMGIGLVLIVAAADADAVLNDLEQIGEKAFKIGQVVPQEGIRIS
ncbi:MAG: phosphoribosylformylglycinamidine cyclo-ligase [Bacillales bacterium]|nr:phosphoribosylformylglycinamidine cyclo-ligase [Bacillales bacterium]